MNKINKIEDIICGILISSLIILLFSQVIARFFLGSSFAWAEEISRYCLLALVYISSSIAVRDRKHIRITGHLERLSNFWKIIFKVLAEGIWLFFNIAVIYLGMKLIIGMNLRPQISGALMINMKYIFAIIPFGFFLQTIRLVETWIIDLKKYTKENKYDISSKKIGGIKSDI